MTLLLVFFAWNHTHQKVSIVLGGDLMLARDAKAILTDTTEFGDALPILQNADIAAANLESPLTSEVVSRNSSAGYNLCGAGFDTAILRSAGFDLFSISNNHQEDCTPNGFVETRKLLEENGLAAAGRSQNPALLQIKGQKIAFLAYEDVTQPLDLVQVLHEVAQVRSKVDLLIVSLHWGNEYQAGPDDKQEKIAQSLADAGVDVIWGHHPHVLQRIEWLQSSEGTHQTLVIYSLGNLLSDQNMTEDVRRTALIRLLIQGGNIKKVEMVPLAKGISSGTLQLAARQDQQAIMDRLQWDALTRSEPIK